MFKYVFIYLLPFFLNSSPVEKVRQQFPYINSFDECVKFEELLQAETSVDAQAYSAAMVLMKSKFVKSVIKKYSYFKKGKNQLDQIINEHPKNVEFRYIRYGFQKNIPSFLGYNNNIDEDFKLFSEGILPSGFPKSYKKKMLTNLLDLKNNSEKQKQKLNLLYNKL